MNRHKVPKKHTGKTMHKGMSSYSQGGHGKKDPHASALFHSNNAQHGINHDLSPADMADSDEATEGLAGGNMECC